MPTTITSAGITFNDATSLTSANIGTTQLVNGSVTAAKLGTNEQKQIAKAWVNFDGTTATPSTIRSAYNVSSITKNGTGDYTVNFTTPMTDANYAICGIARQENQATDYLIVPSLKMDDIPTQNSFNIITGMTASTYGSSYVNIVVFGN